MGNKGSSERDHVPSSARTESTRSSNQRDPSPPSRSTDNRPSTKDRSFWDPHYTHDSRDTKPADNSTADTKGDLNWVHRDAPSKPASKPVEKVNSIEKSQKPATKAANTAVPKGDLNWVHKDAPSKPASKPVEKVNSIEKSQKPATKAANTAVPKGDQIENAAKAVKKVYKEAGVMDGKIWADVETHVADKKTGESSWERDRKKNKEYLQEMVDAGKEEEKAEKPAWGGISIHKDAPSKTASKPVEKVNSIEKSQEPVTEPVDDPADAKGDQGSIQEDAPSKAEPTGGGKVKEEPFVFGFDTSHRLTQAKVEQLKPGIVIVRLFKSNGTIDPEAIQSIKNAKKGARHVGAYLFYCRDKTPEEQIENCSKALSDNELELDSFWLDVEDTEDRKHWPKDPAQNAENLDKLIKESKKETEKENGAWKVVVIYSNKTNWERIFGRNCTVGSDMRLCYARYPGANPDGTNRGPKKNFKDFDPCGGFTEKNLVAKQYLGNVKSDEGKDAILTDQICALMSRLAPSPKKGKAADSPS